MTGPTNLIVELHVAEGGAAAFVAMFRREFVARSRAEPGCLLYDLWADAADPCRLTIVESWAARADLDRHLATDWFREWGPRMEAALRAPPAIRFLTDAM